MGFHKYFFCAVIALVSVMPIYAQTQKIAIRKNRVARAATPSEKLHAIFDLCDETESLHTDTLYDFAQKAKKLASLTHNTEALRISAYYEAYSYYRKSKLDSVTVLFQTYATRLKQESPGSSYNTLFDLLRAKCFLRKKEYKEALEQYYHILNSAEKTKDTLNQMRAMAGIGSALNRTGDHEGALSWFLQGIRLSKRIDYRNKTIFLYTNAAVLYNRQGKYDSSLFYIQQAIRYAREAENLGDLTNALGMYAAQLMDSNGQQMDLKKYAEAGKPLREALEVSEKIGNPDDIISNMGALGVFYYDISQPGKGIAICLKAIDMIRKNHLNGKLPYIYDILAKNYESSGKFKDQASALQHLVDSKDSIYQQNSAEAMSELKTKFEVQKKETTIIRQQLDLVKKDYLIYSSVSIFLLVVLILYFLFRNYRKKQKRKAAMAVTYAEESERKRIAADLHDNLGAYASSIASNVNRLTFPTDSSAELAALQEVKNNSNAIVADLSDTIWALKKEALPLTSVSDRLKIFIQRIQSGFPDVSIDISENISNDYSLSPTQGFHLFQILKEAINNSLKHSGCSHIMIHVEGSDYNWQIRVSDNGMGFQKTPLDTGGGNGLGNMKNRAIEAGWEISWRENKPRGTTVTIQQKIAGTN